MSVIELCQYGSVELSLQNNIPSLISWLWLTGYGVWIVAKNVS